MKNFLQFGLSIICSAIICSPIHAAASEQSLDRIVAIVNDAPITQTELNESIDTAKKQIAASNTAQPSNEVLHKQVLQQIIDRKLQIQLAEQAGIHIKDEDIDKAITHIAQQNNMTMAQLSEQLVKQGLTMEAYRKEISEEIMIQQVQQHEIGAKITITPQEISDFTRSKAWQAFNNKEYHLEDLVVSLPDTPSTQEVSDAKKRADAILDKIHHGSSFQAVAMAESSGNKALQGGDLGWRKLPEIPSAFSSEVIRMQANDIAGPIQTSNGFHILRLAEVRSTGANNAISNKQIEQLIFQRKMEEALPAWMAKIRSQSFINMNPAG